MSHPLPIDHRLTLPGELLSWTAVRASGPGGQNVNKVSSKVELRFDLEASELFDPATKERLRALAGAKLDAEGKIVVRSDKTRDQPRNLEDAREKLKALILQALHVPKARKPTKPSRGAVRRRLEDKRRQGDKKQLRKGE